MHESDGVNFTDGYLWIGVSSADIQPIAMRKSSRTILATIAFLLGHALPGIVHGQSNSPPETRRTFDAQSGPKKGGGQGKPSAAVPVGKRTNAIATDPASLPEAGGLSSTDPRFARLYGPGVFVMDALADINVGTVRGTTYIVSHRFRATASGRARSLRAYWPAGPGYSAGNGGTINIRILPDDGSAANLPDLSAAPLSTGVYSPGLIMGRHVSSSFNDEVPLGSKTALVAGELYHVVYQNIAPDPSAHWIGVNHVVTVERNGRPARWLSPKDWAVLFGYRPAGSTGGFTWKDATRETNSGLYYAPILQLGLENGTYLGAADIETGNIEARGQTSLNANQSIRERFTPSTQRKVAAFSVSTATTTGGELEWSITRGDQVMSSGVIAQANANYSTVTNSDLIQGVFHWYDVYLPAALNLEPGNAYDLTFTPRGASQWRFADEYSGTNRKFAVSFSESQAQTLRDGKWINTTHRSHLLNNPVANWRVVLHLAP